MGSVFYDHLIILTEVGAHIKGTAETEEERHELWHIVDEIVHHRMLELFLDHLAHEHHDEFLEKFHACPHDEMLLDYLNEKIEGEIEELIQEEIGNLSLEIIKEIRVREESDE